MGKTMVVLKTAPVAAVPRTAKRKKQTKKNKQKKPNEKESHEVAKSLHKILKEK